MATKAKVPPRTREQRLAERYAELDWQQQMEAQHQAERAEQQKEHDEFAARVQAAHDAQDAFIRRSWAQRSSEPMSEAAMAQARREIQEQLLEQMPPGSVPTLDAVYQDIAAEERAAAEAAEAARLAAITPRQLWMSTLSLQERERIGKWQELNKMPWPMPGLD